MEKNKEPILIIDADVTNFTVCRVTEDISDFGDQVCQSFDEEATIRLFEEELKKIGEKTGYDVKDIYCALSSPTNFRKKKFPTYKSNRKAIVRPLGLKFLRQHQLDNANKYNTVMIEDLEGD